MCKIKTSFRSVLLFISVWIIISHTVSDVFYRIPQLSHRVSCPDNRTSKWDGTNPISRCSPDIGSELEKTLKVIRRDYLRDRKNQRKTFCLYRTYFVFGKKLMGFSPTCLWRTNAVPIDQMRRALIAYIHHKEDQH